MRLKSIYIIALMFVLVILFSSCRFFWRENFNLGNEAIAKIENFKKDNGRLPESLAEIGIKETEGGPIFYHKKSPSRYLVWFTTGFDDGYFYDSETKEWKAYPSTPFPGLNN